MDGATPGPDERRIRSILLRRGVGYDAAPPAVPPELPAGYEPVPAADWWDRLYDDEPQQPETPRPRPAEEHLAADEPEPEEQPDRPAAFAPQPDYWPRPRIPAVPDRATAAISPGTRRLLYNVSAAGAGWGLGLYDQFAAALADCGTNYSIGGALVLGIGGSLLIAHVWDRRTRHWWPGIAWVARIPLATAVLALALWAPAA